MNTLNKQVETRIQQSLFVTKKIYLNGLFGLVSTYAGFWLGTNTQQCLVVSVLFYTHTMFLIEFHWASSERGEAW